MTSGGVMVIGGARQQGRARLKSPDEAVLDLALRAIERHDPQALSAVTRSVQAQIAYLRERLHGRGDPRRLDAIILGVQAAKEFDGRPDVADPLHDAAALARRLGEEWKARRRRARTPALLRRLFGKQDDQLS